MVQRHPVEGVVVIDSKSIGYTVVVLVLLLQGIGHPRYVLPVIIEKKTVYKSDYVTFVTFLNYEINWRIILYFFRYNV